MYMAFVWFLPRYAIQPPVARDAAPQGRRGSFDTVISMSPTLVGPVFESPIEMIMDGPVFESPKEMIFTETSPLKNLDGNVPLFHLASLELTQIRQGPQSNLFTRRGVKSSTEFRRPSHQLPNA
jgi:hypothetical protein